MKPTLLFHISMQDFRCSCSSSLKVWFSKLLSRRAFVSLSWTHFDIRNRRYDVISGSLSRLDWTLWALLQAPLQKAHIISHSVSTRGPRCIKPDTMATIIRELVSGAGARYLMVTPLVVLNPLLMVSIKCLPESKLLL